MKLGMIAAASSSSGETVILCPNIKGKITIPPTTKAAKNVALLNLNFLYGDGIFFIQKVQKLEDGYTAKLLAIPTAAFGRTQPFRHA
jgi:hypothetical protein